MRNVMTELADIKLYSLYYWLCDCMLYIIQVVRHADMYETVIVNFTMMKHLISWVDRDICPLYMSVSYIILSYDYMYIAVYNHHNNIGVLMSIEGYIRIISLNKSLVPTGSNLKIYNHDISAHNYNEILCVFFFFFWLKATLQVKVT